MQLALRGCIALFVIAWSPFAGNLSYVVLHGISGVTGADIKKRLRAILAGGIAYELRAGKKVSLAAIALVALVVPVLNAPVIHAQDRSAVRPKFEVAHHGRGHSALPVRVDYGSRYAVHSKVRPGNATARSQACTRRRRER